VIVTLDTSRARGPLGRFLSRTSPRQETFDDDILERSAIAEYVWDIWHAEPCLME
jgi:hypothetical protein